MVAEIVDLGKDGETFVCIRPLWAIVEYGYVIGDLVGSPCTDCLRSRRDVGDGDVIRSPSAAS